MVHLCVSGCDFEGSAVYLLGDVCDNQTWIEVFVASESVESKNEKRLEVCAFALKTLARSI